MEGDEVIARHASHPQVYLSVCARARACVCVICARFSCHDVSRCVQLPKAYAKWLDESNADRDLDEQEARATERFLNRHVCTVLL